VLIDLDETIKQLLIKKGALDPAEVDFSFDTPKREWTASISKPTINAYLYDIRENRELRGTEWFVQRDQNGMATRKKNPSRIDLSYLITIWTNDVEDEHRLLWHVLLTLFRYPVFPEDILAGQLADQVYPIKTTAAQPDGLFSNPADFWTALDNELKPSINFVVTLPLDTDLAFTAPVVKTKRIDFKAPDSEKERLIQVAGVVHEAGKPSQVISRARVVAKEARMTAETDDHGRYAFPRLAEGKHTLQVLVSGKKVQEASITIPSANYDLEVTDKGGDR
jgi:hypothetical protein